MPDFSDAQGFVYDAASPRDYHRITAIFSVDRPGAVANEFETDYSDLGEPVASHLSFDRLASGYIAAKRQFPRVLDRRDLDVDSLHVRVPHVGQLQAARLWILGLPHGAVVVAVTVEITCDVVECIALMEALHHKRFSICGRDPFEAICELASPGTQQLLRDAVFGVDVHQILFVAGSSVGAIIDADSGAPRTEQIANLIYRYKGSYRDHAASDLRIFYPPEANRGSETLAAAGPYVAVLAGQQGYIENAFFVSAVQMLGATALLRRVRIETYDELLRLRRLTTDQARDPRRERTQLAVMSERLGKLELELSFGVEAHERIGSLLPSLRVIDYHHAIFCAGDMPAEAATVGRMLDRLGRIIQAELEGVRVRERMSDERRRLVGSIALGSLYIIALPLGIICGFFGINTSDVQPGSSFLDLSRYALIYGMIGLTLIVELTAIALIFYFFKRDDARADSHRLQIAQLNEI